MFLNNVDDIEACVDQTGAATGIPDIAVVTTRESRSSARLDVVRGEPAAGDLRHEGPAPADVPGERGPRFPYYQKKFGKDLHGGLPCLLR